MSGSAVLVFFFQAEDGIRDAHEGLEFRRVLFRSAGRRAAAPCPARQGAAARRPAAAACRLRRPWRHDDRIAPGRRRQLGRASCRARVCQYGVVSVVAVPLKTTDTRTTTAYTKHETTHPSHRPYIRITAA